MTIQNHSLSSNAKPASASNLAGISATIKTLPMDELITLRYELDALLPLDLAKLDLAQELSLQFQQAKLLLSDVQKDGGVPANQKAQIFNSVRAQLSDIVKQQESVWGMERLKKFEVAFIKSAGLLTDEARAAFFDLYGDYLKDLSEAPDAKQ